MTTTTEVQQVQKWFTSRIPSQWFTEAAEVRIDGEEILVVGRLAPETASGAAAGEATATEDTDSDGTADVARLKAFREETRQRRMAIAEEAEATFDRRVSWGAISGEVAHAFTTLSVPVMTRLRMDERSVLDTLVRSGVARSRSDALAWCVRRVGSHEGDWLADLREALVHVEKVRAGGPIS
ncbi:MAG: hypothetical protein ACR2G7_03165 [Acidimicrobiales bacterium]